MGIRIKDIEQYRKEWQWSCSMRGVDDQLEVLETISAKRKRLHNQLNELRAKRNTLLYTDPNFRTSSDQIADLEGPYRDLDRQLGELLYSLPNFLHPDTPPGTSDVDNVVIQSVGTPTNTSLRHEDLPEFLYCKDAAGRVCGARTSIFRGDLAKLKLALEGWLIKVHMDAGFDYVDVPSIVSQSAMVMAGKLPKFAADAFVLSESSWLASTGEIPLVCLIPNSITKPVMLMTCSQCFRKEAGAAGRDTRGWVRQHQFTKIELVVAAQADRSDECFEILCARVAHVLDALKLVWRRVLICAGDIGFGVYKQVDFEVWMAGQGRWLEVCSVSDCRTYQSTRLNIKDKGKHFVHTLNATGGVPGRLLAAIVEQYYCSLTQAIRIPDILQPTLGISSISLTCEPTNK
jgi:seryl-tRNA synthetase